MPIGGPNAMLRETAFNALHESPGRVHPLVPRILITACRFIIDEDERETAVGREDNALNRPAGLLGLREEGIEVGSTDFTTH